MILSKEEYAQKIAIASPLQLIIINYELILDFLNEAKINIDNDNEYYKNIKKAHNFLKELLASLDMRHELSDQLFYIYIYVNKLFVSKILKKEIQGIEEAEKILNTLMEGFMNIREDNSYNCDNAARVFAGLTYNNRGQLDEYYDIANRNDYKA